MHAFHVSGETNSLIRKTGEIIISEVLTDPIGLGSINLDAVSHWTNYFMLNLKLVIL